MTADQAQANLRTAARLTATQLGLAWPQDGSWTYADLVNYDRALARTILAYPDRFTPAAVQIAQTAQTTHLDPNLDTDTIADRASAFASALTDEAAAFGEDLAAVGTGVRNTLKLSSWLIPALAIGAGVILLVALSRRTGATA